MNLTLVVTMDQALVVMIINTGGDDDVCSDTINGATNMFDYDCSFYNGNPDDCGGYDNNNPGAGPICNAYEMCCNCGGGTDYPYPYDCQDGETAVNFYGGNLYQDIGWEIQTCDGSTIYEWWCSFL